MKRLSLMRWTVSEGRTTEVVVSGSNLFGEIGVRTAFLDSPDVLVEFVGNFSNDLEVTRLDHDVDIRLVVFIASQSNRTLKGIANLAPIPSRSHRAGTLVLFFEKVPRELNQSLRVALHFHWRLAGTTNQVPPDLPGSLPVQRWIVQRHVYPGLESLVESTDSVSCQKSTARISMVTGYLCVRTTYKTPS